MATFIDIFGMCAAKRENHAQGCAPEWLHLLTYDPDNGSSWVRVAAHIGYMTFVIVLVRCRVHAQMLGSIEAQCRVHTY